MQTLRAVFYYTVVWVYVRLVRTAHYYITTKMTMYLISDAEKLLDLISKSGLDFKAQ